jgi:hypothetical protein
MKKINGTYDEAGHRMSQFSVKSKQSFSRILMLLQIIMNVKPLLPQFALFCGKIYCYD